MSKLDDEKLEENKLTEEQLEIQRLELELERNKKEQLRRELELEAKKLELRKKELEKQELLVRELEKESEEVIEKEKKQEKIAVKTENESATSVGIVNNELAKQVEETKSKQLVVVLSVLFAVVLLIFSIQYYSTKKYYDSIPLILNAEDFAGKTANDIVEIYGRPDDPNNKYYHEHYDEFRYSSGLIFYDMGDYELGFTFEHGFLAWVTYTPDELFTYKKSPKDALYLFGLEDKSNMFVEAGYPSVFRIKGDNSLKLFRMERLNEEAKTAEYLTLYYKEQYPERKVFEGDFSKTPVVFDLVQYLYADQMSVINSLGSNVTISANGRLTYNTDLGELEMSLDENKQVDYIHLELNEPMKYETSIQEVMVMFGVDPYMNGIYLNEYVDFKGEFSGDKLYYLERYSNFKGVNSHIRIDDIDLENKTFKEIFIFNMKQPSPYN